MKSMETSEQSGDVRQAGRRVTGSTLLAEGVDTGEDGSEAS